MAYYNSNYLEGNTGEYQDTFYNTSYDVPFQYSQSHSDFELIEPQTNEYNHSTSYDIASYDFSDPKLIEYTTSYDSNYVNNSEMNYSMYSFSEPTTVEYDPAPYQTQYLISYKTVTFNELDNIVYDPIPSDGSFDEYDPTPSDGSYDEYDPTPYDGGYDQIVTYGKPLSPSDQICYPRSNPKPTGLSLDGFSYNSILSPYGTHDSGSNFSAKPNEESKFADGGEGKKSNGDNEGTVMESIDLTKPTDGVLESALVEQFDMGNGVEIEAFNNGHDYPWLEYDYGYGNGRVGGYDKYDCDKKIVAQTQHGYGSDGVNYCESIFGYWPCLAKKNKKKIELIQENGDKRSGCDLSKETDIYKDTAEYIFGSALGCGEASGRDSNESYYRQQPCYGQEMYYEKCDENSWIQKYSIF